MTGPGNTSQALTATATVNDLAVGSYAITALNVTAAGVVYVPTPATQSIAVSGGLTAKATVTYALSTFGLRAQQIVEGLSSPSISRLRRMTRDCSWSSSRVAHSYREERRTRSPRRFWTLPRVWSPAASAVF